MAPVIGSIRILPYLHPPPVPLTWTWLNPCMLPVGSQPAFQSLFPQSGPSLTIPKGTQGPGKTFPPPSTPIYGSTYLDRSTCEQAYDTPVNRVITNIIILFFIKKLYVS